MVARDGFGSAGMRTLSHQRDRYFVSIAMACRIYPAAVTNPGVNERTDQELLREYAVTRRDPAFTELVRRHVDFVYSVALRLVRDTHLAEDVTQAVFLAVASNAPKLAAGPALEGWLHVTTRNLAANTVRSEVRRRTREQEAADRNEMAGSSPDADWAPIALHLDEALGELTDLERDALLLRYFKNLDFRSVGMRLGVSDDAAQKRVGRALERLRECFMRRGITVGAGGLAAGLVTNGVQAAPGGLVAGLSSWGTPSLPMGAIASGGAAKAGITALFSALLSPLITFVVSDAVHRRVVASAMSVRERSVRQRFGRRIVLSNVFMAMAGIPPALIDPASRPWLFASSLVLLVIIVVVGVALQIVWSVRHRRELEPAGVGPPLIGTSGTP